MAYLHLINNNSDGVAFERVVNVPSRKIGKVTLSRLRNWAQGKGVPMLEAARNVDQIESIKPAASSKLKQFVRMIDGLVELATSDVETIIKAVLDATGYREYLTNDGSEEGFERANNVDELVVAAQEFDSEHPDDGGLERYLEQTALVSDTDAWEAAADYVTLMTLHAAKGLEFPHVYLVGMEDGILPHERSCDSDDEIEEERRLLFVGITRAQENLQLSRCLSRFRRGSYWPAIASRFLMELPRDEMEVHEPRNRRGQSEQDLRDSLSQMTDWSSDPNDEFFDDVPADEPEPEPEPAPKKPLPVMADLMTGAQLEKKQSAMTAEEKMDPEQFNIGVDVEHMEYGVGTVTSVTGVGLKRTAKINFPQFGEKQFRVAFSNLRKA